ncbi:MAG: hypothetical protein GX190_00675 [Mollicutes bacterium]|nr:hypothetical protein [Mollicutes bacterium]
MTKTDKELLDNIIGDSMRNYIMPVVLCILIGFLLSKFMLNQYQDKQNIVPVFNSGQTLYFFQYGVYSSFESMQDHTQKLSGYIYNYDNNFYYVFIAITASLENVEILKGYFKSIGYDIYVKEFNITDKEFLEILEYYDVLLGKTKEPQAIQAICRQVLEKYKERVLNEHQN